MSSSSFVHLHLHSEYSLLDGAIQFEKLGPYLSENGMDTVALTDHGSLFGAVHFCDRMREAGIRPVIGSEVYIVQGSRFDKRSGGGMPSYFHLTLLAATEEGYRNLMRLSSSGYLEGHYYKPRIDREILEKHSSGLIIGSACLQGEVARYLLAGNPGEARRVVEYYQDLVGGDGFFIELMDHGLEDEKRILEDLADLARSTGALPVATNDAHYLRRDDARAHEALLCLQTGKTLSDPSRMRFGTGEFYVKTPEEMEKLFSWLPEAVTNSAVIASRCSFAITPGEFLLPHAPMPSGYSDQNEYLSSLASDGLENRLGRKPDRNELERLQHELGIIGSMGFPGYFLIVSELMRWARSRGIPVGPGRGSAAGSLVSYAVDITDVNPLDHDLSFERFLNPARAQMPDIDLDVCVERRGEIIDHMKELYGEDSVCQIITFSRMKKKAVVRDIARVLGMTYAQGDAFAKVIGEIDDGTSGSLEELAGTNSRLKELVDTTPGGENLLEFADSLEGIARHAGVHAAGVVIAPGRLDAFVPLYYNSEKGVTTQYEMKSAEKIGLLKLDVLGLRTVTVIHHAVEDIRRTIPGFSIEEVPSDDQATLEMISSGDTTAVFQLESSGMRDALRKIGVNRFDDVTAAVAIYRPGSMHMIDLYAQNKEKSSRGESIQYPHPLLEEVLRGTYGVTIYQEQVMRIANVLAGMDMAEADNLRRAMSKKIAGKMAVMKDVFLEGASKKGISRKKATEIWDLIARFAEYGFNKSHAVCYAIIAYRTAYLKRHFPSQFMAAVLSSEIGSVTKLRDLVREAERLGVKVVPPSVNGSMPRFVASGEREIMYALSAIKNVGFTPADEIRRAREDGGPFTTVFDLCARVAMLEDSGGINKRTLEALILAGAADCLEGNRAQQLSAMEQALSYASGVRQHHNAGQMSLFGEGSVPEPVVPALPAEEEIPLDQKLEMEREMLGFYFSGHPLDEFAEEIAGFTTHGLEGIQTAGCGRVVIAGTLVSRRVIETRKGPMAFVTISDRNAACEAILFSEALQNFGDSVTEGAHLLMEGEMSQGRGDRGMRLSIERVMPLAESRKRLRAGVLIEVEGFHCSRELLERTASLLEENRGSGRLFFKVVFPGGTRRLTSRQPSVEPSDLVLRELRRIMPRTAKVSLCRGDGR